MLKALWTTLLDLLFPPKCPVCRQAVDNHGTWCQRCLRAVQGTRSLSMTEHRLKWLDGCYAACDYVAGVKRLIHDMKFRQADRYAVHLSWLVQTAYADTPICGLDAAMAVPLHAERLAERGYNQSELIFKKWAMSQGLPWLDVLERSRSTIPQWELSLAERRQNIKGAFVITRPESVQGKHILLVDDIFTSGITMDECAKVLKQAGAKRVIGLVVASGSR